MSPRLSFATFGAALLVPAAVWSQDLAGTWRTTRDDLEVTVREWGEACGPRPSAHHGSPGRDVTVRESGGALVVDGGGHSTRTDRCWSDNRDVVLRSASHPSATRWLTSCSTPDGSALAERGTYTTRGEATTLSLRDETEYEWHIQGSMCRASAVQIREYERAQPAAPTPPTPPAPTPPAPTPEPPVQRCATHGSAAVVAVFPARRSLPVGGRTCFHVRVFDGRRCEVPGAAVEWSWRRIDGAAEAVTQGGCISSRTGEGTWEATATSGALSGRATASVVSAGAYESMAAAHVDEVDAGDEEVASAPSVGVYVAPEPRSAGGHGVVKAIVAALLGLLVAGAVIAALLRRRRGPRPDAGLDDEAAPIDEAAPEARRAGPADVTMPIRRRESPPVEVPSPIAQAPAVSVAPPPPAAVSVPDPAVVVAPAPPSASPSRACPVCAKVFVDGSVFCTDDGSTLVAVAAGAATSAATRSCPRCARRYAAPMDFCVEDGERLRDG